ncbi:MAG: hypothetical protein DSO04_02785 [Hadesarchaea archaeon]|nr:MAG: hypothetical protein DSO04_02785 [Hadesarchaea archaeon]
MDPRRFLAPLLILAGSLLMVEASTPSPSSLQDLSLLCLGAALTLSGFLLAVHLPHAFSSLLLGLGVSLLLQRGEKGFSEATSQILLLLSLLLFLLALLPHRLLRPRK